MTRVGRRVTGDLNGLAPELGERVRLGAFERSLRRGKNVMTLSINELNGDDPLMEIDHADVLVVYLVDGQLGRLAVEHFAVLWCVRCLNGTVIILGDLGVMLVLCFSGQSV